VTVPAAESVSVQLFVLLPPLEQAPDQTPSRPLEIESVIAVPVVNEADPVLPTGTAIPAGLELTVSPLLPVAVTVRVEDEEGGGGGGGFGSGGGGGGGGGGDAEGVTVKIAVVVTPPPDTEMVTSVWTLTAEVKTLKPPLVVPAGTIMLPGTGATVGLLLATWKVVSVDWGEAMLTVANVLPL
jgi:hypothetical protein